MTEGEKRVRGGGGLVMEPTSELVLGQMQEKTGRCGIKDKKEERKENEHNNGDVTARMYYLKLSVEFVLAFSLSCSPSFSLSSSPSLGFPVNKAVCVQTLLWF